MEGTEIPQGTGVTFEPCHPHLWENDWQLCSLLSLRRHASEWKLTQCVLVTFQSLGMISLKRTWVMRGNGQAHWSEEGGHREERPLGPRTNVGIMRAARARARTDLRQPQHCWAASGWEARLRGPTRPSLIHPSTHPPIHLSVLPLSLHSASIC